jgi:hypothetical protein
MQDELGIGQTIFEDQGSQWNCHDDLLTGLESSGPYSVK